MLKGAVVAPAGTTAMAGICAAELLLVIVTVAPPVGAGALRLIDPATLAPPEVWLDESVIEARREPAKKGFKNRNTSVDPFVSVGIKLVAFEENTKALPFDDVAATPALAFPRAPPLETLTSVDSPAVRSTR